MGTILLRTFDVTHIPVGASDVLYVLVDMSGYPWMRNYGTNVIIVIMCDYKIRVMLSRRHVCFG